MLNVEKKLTGIFKEILEVFAVNKKTGRQFDIGISLEMGNLAKDCDKKKK